MVQGDTAFVVHAFGPGVAMDLCASNWSLKTLQTSEDVKKEDNIQIVNALKSTLGILRVHKALAPNVAPASGEVIAYDSPWPEMLEIGQGICIHRNPKLPADGVFLNQKEAFIMSGAGCPIIITSVGGKAILAHAARDSLVPRNWIENNTKKQSGGIVQNIFHAIRLVVPRVKPSDIMMHMVFSIPAKSFVHCFDDPSYGDYNRALSRFVRRRWCDGIRECVDSEGVYLDLGRIFLGQAVDLGIRNAEVSQTLDMRPDLAHTRDGHSPSRRNLIVVKRVQ